MHIEMILLKAGILIATALSTACTSRFGNGSIFNSDINSINPSVHTDCYASSAGSQRSERNKPEGNCEAFVFFTDPHLYPSTNSFDINYEWYRDNIPILLEVYNRLPSHFIMCGGDLINDFDTKQQAKSKLAYFVDAFKIEFDDFYIVAGNHDTNYLGDTYVNYRDSQSCMLSIEELEEILFNGNKSYYSFDTAVTKNYCFNSGIDWDSNQMNDFRWEQIDWFARDLKNNDKSHVSIFIHIALFASTGKQLSEFMVNIGHIISAFNEKSVVQLNDKVYDYSLCSGHIDFIQAGHEHADVDGFMCGGVPVIITTTFSHPSVATQPTFDYVYVDYDSMTVDCKRFGDGTDRVFFI